MKIKKFILLLSSVMLAGSALACTAVAVTGKNYLSAGSYDATMLVRNRDAVADHYERLVLYKPQGKYSYLALAFTSKLSNSSINFNNLSDYQYITSGTNDKLLTIVANDASTNSGSTEGLTGAQRNEIETAVVKNVLENYSSIPQLIPNLDKVFKNSGIALYTLADARNVLSIQVYPDGTYSYQTRAADSDSAYVWNTNKYTLNSAKDSLYNTITGLSSTENRTKIMNSWFNTLATQNGAFPLSPNTLNNKLNEENIYSYNDGLKRDKRVAKYTVLIINGSGPYDIKKLLLEMTLATQNYDRYDINLNTFFSQNTQEGFVSAKYSLCGASGCPKPQILAATPASNKTANSLQQNKTTPKLTPLQSTVTNTQRDGLN